MTFPSFGQEIVNVAEIPIGNLNIAGQALGDLIYFDGANWNRRPAGANNQVLNVAAGIPTWTGTVLNLALTNPTIVGGSINNTPIGAVTPASIVGTTIDAGTGFTVDGLVISADSIRNDQALTIDTLAGNLILDPVGDIILSPSGITQNYAITDTGATLAIQGQNSGSFATIAFLAKDADGSDQVGWEVYGFAPTFPSIANRERLEIGWLVAGLIYRINVDNNGTGSARNFELQDDGVPWLTKVASGAINISARLSEAQGADVGSANDLALGNDGNVFEITGAVQINRIVNTGWQNGATIILMFTSTPTVKDAQASAGVNITILLDGSADFVASAGDTLQLTLGEIGGVQAWRQTGGQAVL